MLDLGKIRGDFPILSEEVNGHKLVYLDSGASAQKPTQVLERIQHAYAHEYANVHRGLHTLSNRATEAFEAARGKVQKFLNAERTDEIVFTRSATEAINLVAQSFLGPKIGEGDEIIITKMEHHSNIVPWHFLRERQGAVIKWLDVNEDGSFDLDAFEAAITDRTKMVALTQMSNVMGTIVPIKQVAEIAHARDIPVMVDGSQGAVHLPVDVQDLDVDFYVATGHKLYGPTGIGILYGKYDRLLDTRPFNGGGEMIADVFEDSVTYADPPHRFEAGTPPIVQAIGLGAAIDYIESIGRDKIKAHEDEIGDYARQELLKINALRLIGDAPGKGAIFSFAIENVHAHDLSTILDRYGVAVRAGSHCAQPLLKRFGVTSTCRASFALYNGKDDVDALVNAIGKAQTFFG
ncbi:cysteine desulfurase [Maritalea mediterranea]|uniref:Cysteine desulfurase n=1 Tax=Maritalea mediterranea TaxID=2909667 RepID=A0ABS9EEE5_9HYPH|nr:cysteine desulfurase [Maritalea mediterranea]MCF4099826.1 cysteine desulfurase [Maritalea mediterranea]